VKVQNDTTVNGSYVDSGVPLGCLKQRDRLEVEKY